MKEIQRPTLTGLPETPYYDGVPRFNRGRGGFVNGGYKRRRDHPGRLRAFAPPYQGGDSKLG